MSVVVPEAIWRVGICGSDVVNSGMSIGYAGPTIKRADTNCFRSDGLLGVRSRSRPFHCCQGLLDS